MLIANNVKNEKFFEEMKKNKSIIIVAALLVAFVLGLIFLNRDDSKLDKPFVLSTNKVTTANVVVVNENNFQGEVIKSELPVLVDFYADWCGPCKRQAPILEELAVKYKGKIKFAKLNVDENQNLSATYRIDAIPHLIVFKNGKVIDNIIGLHSKADMENELSALLVNG